MRHAASGDVICSPRHFDDLCRLQMRKHLNAFSWADAEQGFVDQYGEFLNRTQYQFN